MTPFNDKMNYRLEARLNLLPRLVYSGLKREFVELCGGTERRWRAIVTDSSVDIRAREAMIFIKHIGCTLEELITDTSNLQAIYIERIQKPENDAKAEKYGLADL